MNLAQRRKLDFSCFGMAAPPQRWPRLPCPWQRPHGSVGGNPHGRLETARRSSGHRASDGVGHAGTQSRFRHSRVQMGGHRHAGPGGFETGVPRRKGSAWAHETNLSTAIVRAPSAGPGTAAAQRDSTQKDRGAEGEGGRLCWPSTGETSLYEHGQPCAVLGKCHRLRDWMAGEADRSRLREAGARIRSASRA